MQAAKRFGWVPMAVLALVLASILAFLYSRTRTHDNLGYFENIAMLRQLKQLDSRWELDVLKSRMGINSNYDSLVDPLVELNQLREELGVDVSRQQHASAGALTKTIEALHQSVKDKTRLIESFKSQNSVLRNSLAFLPTAAEDIQRVLPRGGAASPLAASVNRLLRDCMVYAQAPDEDKAKQIQGDLDNLQAARGAPPAAVAESVEIFVAHVRTVLREQPVVNSLLTRIAAVPVGEHIDDLHALLNREQRESEVQGQRYGRYLLLFAAALIGLVLYAAVSLIRSHAEINRVNKALQEVNATLEQRVQERTRELHAAQSELVTTARHAGMAEIANNVLHNVGNVLNSVNVSAGLVSSKVRESKARGLSKAVQLMSEHEGDLGSFFAHDDKGKALPGYLKKLDGALAAEQQEIVAELGSLTRSVDHIKDIVTMQQSYAGSAKVAEAVQVKDLVEDALRINGQGLSRCQITPITEFAEVPLLRLDKHLVLQILVNLIGNARQAMEGVQDRAPQIRLRMEVDEPAADPRLRIRVEDNGSGIAPENLTRLFAHGFTTRKNGHGFGLHSCALAARQMGGTLSAYSEGLGKGATFILELPMKA